MPEFSLITSKANFVVMGEGEETIIELIKEMKGENNFKKVEGIVYKNNNQIVINNRRLRRQKIELVITKAI